MPLWLRLLTIITFACAVAGLISPLLAGESATSLVAPDMVPGALFFLLAIAVSVLTWRRTPGGAFLMLILQLVQVVSISGAGGRSLVARCGPVLEVTLAPGGYRLGGGLQVLFADLSSSSGLSLLMTYGSISDSLLEIATLVLGINMLPLFMAWQIWVYLGQVVETPTEAQAA